MAVRRPFAIDRVVDGRFKGGWITRHYGRPAGTSTPSRWSSPSAPIMLEAAALGL